MDSCFVLIGTRQHCVTKMGSKWVQSTELDIVNGSLCNLCTLAVGLALHIFATQCWRVPIRTKQLSTVAILLYRFLAVLVSRNVFRSISLAIYCLSSHIFWLIRSLVDPTLAAFIVCGPLQFVSDHDWLLKNSVSIDRRLWPKILEMSNTHRH